MSTASTGHALGRVLVDELARAGLTDVCLSPGSRSAPLALAFAADPRIAVHVVLDERSAAFAALGIGKGSGRPAAVLCTSGTAGANLHPAVIEARESRTPLIVLTADRPPELRDAGANQTTDQVKLFGSAVRWFCEVGVPEARSGSVAYWRSVAARASAEAQGSPAGAVHLNLAFREPLVADPGDGGLPFPLDGRAESRPWTEVRFGGRGPAESDVKWLTELAEQTEKGIVIAGAGEIEEPGPVLDLAHRAGWPVIAEPASGLRLDEHAISTYDALLRVEGFRRFHRPDLVIRIGRLGLSRALGAFLEPEIRQVLIDRDGAWLDPERAVSHVVAADPASICGQVARSLSGRDGSEWLGSWQDAERTARAAIDELLDGENAPSEPRAARDLAAGLTDGSSLVVASSMPVRDLDWFMAARGGLRVVANRGANGIDGVVSTAVGVALAAAAPTAALVGDLALIHDQIGLQLARAEHVDLVVVVINNDGGGIFSFLPHADHPEFERLFGTPHGLDLGTLASLYGCGYLRIERAADLVPAVVAAQGEGGPHVVEVRTERAANVALHEKLWAGVARAIG